MHLLSPRKKAGVHNQEMLRSKKRSCTYRESQKELDILAVCELPEGAVGTGSQGSSVELGTGLRIYDL